MVSGFLCGRSRRCEGEVAAFALLSFLVRVSTASSKPKRRRGYWRRGVVAHRLSFRRRSRQRRSLAPFGF
eukprot:6152958-Alexandrium_andersonii.AAC.1